MLIWNKCGFSDDHGEISLPPLLIPLFMLPLEKKEKKLDSNSGTGTWWFQYTPPHNPHMKISAEFIRSGQNHLARHSKRGKKTKQTEERWEDNTREWTGLEFTKSQWAVENRRKWRNWLQNHVVPRQPSWLRHRWDETKSKIGSNFSHQYISLLLKVLQIHSDSMSTRYRKSDLKWMKMEGKTQLSIQPFQYYWPWKYVKVIKINTHKYNSTAVKSLKDLALIPPKKISKYGGCSLFCLWVLS